MSRSMGIQGIRVVALVTCIVLVGGVQAQAATIPLGSTGWEAMWDASLDGLVQIHVNGETSTELFIQKSAEFTQGPDQFGQFPSIPIVFRQVSPSTLASIVIQDEIITNSTGVDWTDFHFDVLDTGDAVFRNDGSFFFSTTPLDNQAFSNGNTTFTVDGFGLGPGGSDAVVADGTSWFPGDGVSDGNLIIDVISTGSTVFTLKETPTPEPSTVGLLALGGLAALRRKR